VVVVVVVVVVSVLGRSFALEAQPTTSPAQTTATRSRSLMMTPIRC
jgi:hypothetical protein